MKLTLLAGCALACVALSGCASSGQGAAVLNDLQGCHRHYQGTISAGVMSPGSFTGAVEIDCPQGITTGVLIPPGVAGQKPAPSPTPAPVTPAKP